MYVFVYGTLKRNEPNHDKMLRPKRGSNSFIGKGELMRKLPLVIASRHNVSKKNKTVERESAIFFVPSKIREKLQIFLFAPSCHKKP